MNIRNNNIGSKDLEKIDNMKNVEYLFTEGNLGSDGGSKGVKTGDAASLAGLFGIGALSLGGIFGFRRRK